MHYTNLSCGAEDPGDIYQDHEPFRPQILPIPLDRSPPPPSRKRKRSNGCGTILHYGAIVSPNNLWRAAEMIPERNIIPLENICGCVRTGVGCAICGNPLGALFTPCPLHQQSSSGKNYYAILPSAVSPPIPLYTPPSPVPPRVIRPLPPPPRPPTSWTRHRHPTSPPPLMLYADFTPTPSPEVVPAPLPATATGELANQWELLDESVSLVDHGDIYGDDEGEGDDEDTGGTGTGIIVRRR
ncbi:hypothetical protein B0H14DRAFT_2805394 [Mycena olivaceomarginata]|nr:hypothetical protein B0H14DRAFT_2805394 [Mycena olivaceomarginata]